MEVIKGLPVSQGIAIGPGFLYSQNNLSSCTIQISNALDEWDKLHAAICSAKCELLEVYQKAVDDVGVESAEIFQAQIALLDDPDLLKSTEEKIQSEWIDSTTAFLSVTDHYAQKFQAMENEYFRARALDVRDVAQRVVRNLRKDECSTNQPLKKSIILAEDLTPSDTMSFDRSLIAGFFTVLGGTTSHTAILSRALGVPSVVGGGRLPEHLDNEHPVILDGDNGLLIIDPDDVTIEYYRELSVAQANKASHEMMGAMEPAVTIDKKRIDVVANIGCLDDALTAISSGAEGVGLLRTEFSYIEQDRIPDEQGLFQMYRSILNVFGSCPVVVRTLDIGGDKKIPYLGLPVEANPFLGVRGIRLCFTRLDLFKPQLRALLRAGYEKKLAIMFPMIANIGEVRKARSLIQECMQELRLQGFLFNDHPQIGIMIEVPAAAICADQLAKEVDFFSIGTNDLTQYTLAVDRTNMSLSDIASPLQPAVLRLVKQIITCAHAAGIWVGMCGEMSGDPLAIPILLGLGLDEFSMNSPSIPKAKEIIRHIDTTYAKTIAEKAMFCETAHEVETLVRESIYC